MSITRPLVACLVLLSAPARAEDGEETLPPPPEGAATLDISDIMADIDLGPATGKGGGDLINYNGSLNESGPGYVAGKPLAITHTAGSISIRCQDREGVNATLMYEFRGTSEGPLEAMGKGMGLSVWGTATGGGAKTRVPTKSSTIKEAKVDLTVNAPKMANLTVTGGSGAVRISGCEGTVAVSNKSGGVLIEGKHSRIDVTAATGDVDVRLSDDSTLAGASKLTASTGNVNLNLPLAYAGKFSARGEVVSVYHTVAGTNTDTSVSGTINSGSASLTLYGKQEVTVKAP